MFHHGFKQVLSKKARVFEERYTRTCSIRSMAEETLRIFGAGKEWKEKKVEQRKDERRNAGLSVKMRRGKKRQ